MGDVHVFPIAQSEYVPACADPNDRQQHQWGLKIIATFPSQKARLRGWKEGAWDVLEVDLETQTRPLSEVTSDQLRSLNIERVWAKPSKWADRWEAIWPGHRSIVWTQTEPIRLIPAKVGAIVRDDQSDHRACVACSCRGILVFFFGGGGAGGELSSSLSPYHQTLPEIYQTCQSRSKTCPLEICRRRFFFNFTILFVLCHFYHQEVPPKRGFSTQFSSFR